MNKNTEAETEVASGLFRQPEHNADNPIVIIGCKSATDAGNVPRVRDAGQFLTGSQLAKIFGKDALSVADVGGVCNECGMNLNDPEHDCAEYLQTDDLRKTYVSKSLNFYGSKKHQ